MFSFTPENIRKPLSHPVGFEDLEAKPRVKRFVPRNIAKRRKRNGCKTQTMSVSHGGFNQCATDAVALTIKLDGKFPDMKILSNRHRAEKADREVGLIHRDPRGASAGISDVSFHGQHGTIGDPSQFRDRTKGLRGRPFYRRQRRCVRFLCLSHVHSHS